MSWVLYHWDTALAHIEMLFIAYLMSPVGMASMGLSSNNVTATTSLPPPTVRAPPVPVWTGQPQVREMEEIPP